LEVIEKLLGGLSQGYFGDWMPQPGKQVSAGRFSFQN